jgi:hypothetical protein
MWNIKLSRLVTVGWLLVAAALACSFPGTTSEEMPPEGDSAAIVATRVAATMAAGGGAEVPEGAALPPASSETPLPAAMATDTTTPTITQTPTDTLTPTPAVPMASVTLNTNCRFGPGLVYEYLGALLEGETAEIHGVNPGGNFWYIENPDQPGEYCWITAAYALVTGDTSQVPVLTPPPTPTYTPVPLNFNINVPLRANCMGFFILYSIENTGPQPIESVSIYVEDLDTGQERSRSESTLNADAACLLTPLEAIPPGGEGHMIVGVFPYDPFGHNVRSTVKVCSENGMGGNCVEKTFTQVVTGVSDAAQKENRDPVDARAVLDRLLEIPIETWNYIAEPEEYRHIGPMAQDFFAAYGLGADDRLSAMDVQGVALASIQALHEIVQEKDVEIVELEARLTALEGSVAVEGTFAERYGLLIAGFLAGAAVVAAVGRIWRWRKTREV